jgi:plastocyanin
MCLKILITNIVKTLIGSKGKLSVSIMIIVAVLSILNSCTKTSSPGLNEVFIQNSAFSPSTITVVANTAITWTNNDGMPHTVTSDTGNELNSGNIPASGTWSHTFTAAGTYPYHCTIHPAMKATVKVN